MRKVYYFWILTFALFLFSISSHALLTRSTSFDNRPVCEESGGVWRQYGDDCVDSCYSKFDKFASCVRDVSFNCDCGRNKCWNGKMCVDLRYYKKSYSSKYKKEKRNLAKAKESRESTALISRELILRNLMEKAESRGNKESAVGAQANYKEFYEEKGISPTKLALSNKNEGHQKEPVKPLNSTVQKPEALKPTTIPKSPPIVIQNSNAPIPPLFLQQEKLKQKEATKQQKVAGQQKQVVVPVVVPKKSEPLALPAVPLPQ